LGINKNREKLYIKKELTNAQHAVKNNLADTGFSSSILLSRLTVNRYGKR